MVTFYYLLHLKMVWSLVVTYKNVCHQISALRVLEACFVSLGLQDIRCRTFICSTLVVLIIIWSGIGILFLSAGIFTSCILIPTIIRLVCSPAILMCTSLEVFVWILVITSCQEGIPMITFCDLPTTVCPPGQTVASPTKIVAIIVVCETLAGYMA